MKKAQVKFERYIGCHNKPRMYPGGYLDLSSVNFYSFLQCKIVHAHVLMMVEQPLTLPISLDCANLPGRILRKGMDRIFPGFLGKFGRKN